MRPGMRLGVFVDAPFHRDPAVAAGALHVHPDAYSFLLFVCAVAERFGALTVFGRQAADAGGLVAVPASEQVRLCGLPAYDSLRDVGRVLRVTAPTARTMWRGLRDVDVLWAMGPHPFGVVGGLLATARGRTVVLGVRQETGEYFKARLTPGQVPLRALLSGLEGGYRLLGRRWRVTAVGSVVARRYGAPRPGVLDMVVPLVRGSQRRTTGAGPLDSVRLITVGRLAVDKNPGLLVEAMAALERRHPGRFRLDWIGTGPLEAQTRQRVDAAGLAHAVSFAGFLPFGPALLERYAAADIFVHVALTEGVPQVLLEAAALGVPIVATRVGGVGDAMDQGRCAVLVPPSDCGALVEAIERVSDLPALRQTIASNATERFADRTLEHESTRVAEFLATGARAPRPSPRRSIEEANPVPADDARTTVTVLIPVLNERRCIRQAVRSLQDQDYRGPVEFVFIDGGSTDGTRDILAGLAAEDPRIRVLDNPRRIAPAALNIGLAATAGEYIVRVDAHSVYPRDYLSLGIARISRGDVASVSGPQLARGSGPWSRRIAAALTTKLGVGEARFRTPVDGEVEVDSGFVGVWRRSTLVEAGGWNEEVAPGEDGELAATIRERGGRIVCLPGMAAEYAPRNNLRELARQYWAYGRSRVQTARLHPDSLRRSHVLAPALAGTVLAAAAGPRRVRTAARTTIGVYALTTAAVSLSKAGELAPRDVAALPAVFGTMHLSWGFGFLWGCLKFGPPVRALTTVATHPLRPLPHQRRPSPAGTPVPAQTRRR
ncbi:hypothetical protein GCM10020358_59700 [Amorphoplanes nipponensis]|uniref:Glycosyltransferase n=1 Tax=Actinoplanes nipponensis TaxID=135950 RepID=A0A919JA63_9ACTN|nr:glycosyltransferase [Actinoplanes nipponensis]GIE46948.1 hypothetical protein Ani05nite_04820 [Actinoplanes nipponensis]